ncbi:hypothetical protein OG292_19145 [Streptomyces sp. NBC_01511]
MIAADIHIDLHDLTETDLDEIQARIEEAVAPWKGTVTVDRRP